MPWRALAQPQKRVPLTSERVQAKPVIARAGAALLRALSMFIRDQKELKIVLLVVGGFLCGFALLIYLIATDV